MALQKQPVAINFSKGLDLKTDPYQVAVGNFLNLKNSIFTNTGRLTKRNGFDLLTTLPNSDQTTLTTLNDNLIATGSNLYAYSKDTDQWLNRGTIQPVQLATQPLIRANTGQVKQDSAIAPNGLICFAYFDSSGAYYYQISDSSTGQQISGRTVIPTNVIATAAVRVFVVGVYFVIAYITQVAGNNHLEYIAIPTASPSMTPIAVTISTDVNAASPGFDGFSTGDAVYFAWAAAASVKVTFLSSMLTIAVPYTQAGATSNLMSVTADDTNNIVYIAYHAGAAGTKAIALDLTLTPLMAPTTVTAPGAYALRVLTGVVTANRTVEFFYEVINGYTYDINVKTDYIRANSITLPVAGVGVGTASGDVVVVRSVGIASKPIAKDGVAYLLAVYTTLNSLVPSKNSNQPSYFLIDSSGNVYMRLAYSVGGSYATNQVVPSIITFNDSYYVPYLIVDLLVPVNKTTSLPAGSPVNQLITQTGINLAQFTLNNSAQYSSEIAGALHLTGGQLWEYDGIKPVEDGFQVWPENVEATTATIGGAMTAQIYNYVFTYEWTDGQGNIQRSAPSIPLTVNLSASVTSTNTATLHVPTLRLTYKIAPNPVRIVGYRWSTAQQVYYQFTNVTVGIVNDTTVDSVDIVDGQADSAILGNPILYTTGGVVENIAPPAAVASALFSNRLFLIDAEDRNLLWFSKQVIENTPVEMSDLLTLYIAPTTGAQGSTGPMAALSAMDDKLIIFKRDAIYYINGSGPDNTGSNSTFSDPIFITSAVGCANPSSIVLMPHGIMFQSDKGIWMLGRDLSTQYIGAPVELYNSLIVESATVVPGTNQVRFMLGNNITLMYDYFFNQWGTHSNVLAISATLYQGVYTYLNSQGQVLQETQGMYTDNSTPVLMSLTTSWINVAGLQGYERFYFANLLGTYFSPFKLNFQMAYDYNSSSIQSVIVEPDNFVENWGGEALWGSGGPWGGPGNVFSARIFPEKQKCESFQITINELYDASLDQSPGQGLSLSGLALVVGVKKGYRTQSARKSFG